MQNYELLYIIPNQYTDDEAAKIKDKVEEVLKGHGANISISENQGKKKLAYPIDHVAHGYYILNEFTLEDGTKLAEINNFLRLDKEILRAQIIIKKVLTAAEIEKQKKREAHRAKAEALKTDAVKPVADKAESKKPTKNLDEKLDEMLTTDDLV